MSPVQNTIGNGHLTDLEVLIEGAWQQGKQADWRASARAESPIVGVGFVGYALVNLADHRVQSGTDARAARWVPVQEAQGLAFDHDRIIAVALERLRGKIRYQPLGFEMLPERFKLSQLQALYEAILGEPVDKRNFRKRFLAMGLLAQAGEERGVPHRAARLFRFEKRRYENLRRRGFDFAI